jgi:hypothetical protein
MPLPRRASLIVKPKTGFLAAAGGVESQTASVSTWRAGNRKPAAEPADGAVLAQWQPHVQSWWHYLQMQFVRTGNLETKRKRQM